MTEGGWLQKSLEQASKAAETRWAEPLLKEAMKKYSTTITAAEGTPGAPALTPAKSEKPAGKSDTSS